MKNLVIFSVMMLSLVLITAPILVSAQSNSGTSTIETLQKQIQQLLTQLQTLQQQVVILQAELGVKTPSSPTPRTTASSTEPVTLATESETETPSVPELTRSLSLGTRGDDVRKLQEFLARDPEIYPEGLATGYYGPKTVEAVKRWQRKNNVEAVGTVGPKTITKFRELGQGVIQGLIQQGAGRSDVRPPGLDMAPGIQKQQLATTTTPTVSLMATTTPPISSSATTTQPIATSTPSQAIPAVPATPATPAQPTQTSATPATSAAPATTTTFWIQSVAPAGLTIDKGTTLHLNPPSVNYSARFDYTLTSDTKSLRIYLKRPNSANFLSYTYNAPMPLLDPSQWNESTASPFLRRTGMSSWYWWPADEFLPKADPARLGEYKIYATALNSAGTESAPSATKSIKIYAPPVISSPLDGSTVSTKPTISFAAGDSSVSDQYYAVYVYKANGTVAWSNGLASTNFVYPGTELNPNDNPHRLVVHAYAAAPNFPQWYSPFSQVTFSVTTTTTAPTATTTPSATTLSAGPSAPANLQLALNGNISVQPPTRGYYIFFNYTLQSNTQSFNIYEKKPTDPDFIKYTYNAQIPVNPSILPLLAAGEAPKLYRRGETNWERWTSTLAPSSSLPLGEYKFYVTAIDTNNVESVHTPTVSFRLYAASTITSPANGSTVSISPTITFTPDPSISSQNHNLFLYKQTTTSIWSSTNVYGTSVTYNGPALNPTDNPHRLIIASNSGPYTFSDNGVSIFNVSTATTTAAISNPALASIIETLNEIIQRVKVLVK